MTQIRHAAKKLNELHGPQVDPDVQAISINESEEPYILILLIKKTRGKKYPLVFEGFHVETKVVGKFTAKPAK